MAFLLVTMSGLRCEGQAECFRSVAEAAAGVGVTVADGFRVEAFRLDVFSGKRWATIVDCKHPERPGVLVASAAVAPQVSPRAKVVEHQGLPVVVAGTAVRVVREDGPARIEQVGTAIDSGAAGARVRVRLQGFTPGAAERLLTGLVQADGTIEMIGMEDAR